MYDGYYPQYQFYQGPRQRNQIDPKYLSDALIQLLFKQQTQGQILDAFTPGGAGTMPGAGGSSYLDQLLSQTQQGQGAGAQPQAAGPAAMQAMMQEQLRNQMMDGGGKYDRQGYGGLGMSGY